MPNGMLGADTDRLREVARSFVAERERVARAASTARSELEGVEWVGPDRDRFVESWNSTVDAALSARADELERIGTGVLPSQADAQDAASGAGGGSGGPNDVEAVEKSEGERNAHDTRVDDASRHRTHEGEIPTDESDIDPYDVNQQALGDCWVLASLAAAAGTDPKRLADNVTYDAETDEYVVTLYDDGEPVEVRVANSFVVGDDGASHQYAVGDDGTPNFASIYEKALAEHYGEDYGDIWGGDPARSLEAITGRDTESVSFDPFWPWQESASSEGISRRIDDGQMVVLSTKSDLPDGSPIVGNHAYTVVDVRDDGSVVLYNPWGSNPTSDLSSGEGLQPGEVVVPADRLGDYFSEMDATR